LNAGKEWANKKMGNTLDFVKNQKTGLTPEEIQGIQSNPYQAEYWNQTRQAIEEQ
jgi:hypothetical protein